MQYDVYRLEDEIVDFDALVNLTVGSNITQVLSYTVSVHQKP